MYQITPYKTYKISIAKKAQKAIKNLQEYDKKAIVEKIEKLTTDEFHTLDIKIAHRKEIYDLIQGLSNQIHILAFLSML